MSSAATVPMFSPDGTLGDVPYEQMKAALAAGAKPGVSIKAPDGSIGVVPADRYQEAAKAGGTIVPIQQQETQHPGFWARSADLLGGLLHPSGFSPYPGMDQDAKSAAAAQSSELNQSEKAAGYSAPYRALVPVARSVGVDVPGMEASARAGDVGGVTAAAAVPIATMAAGEALAHGVPAVTDATRSALETPGGKAATAATKAALKKLPAAAVERIPYVGKVAGDVYSAASKAAAEAKGEAPELDATGENKPFAGGADEPPPQKELDATGENKPFAGGMDEPLPPKKAPAKVGSPAASAAPAAQSSPVAAAPDTSPRAAAPAAAPQRTVVIDPTTGAPEFSDVLAAKQAAKQTQPAATVSADPILAKLQNIAAKNEAEDTTAAAEPKADEDLTDLLQRSVAMVKAKKGGVFTTAAPKELMDRWGVDPESFTEGRSQTRGMSPQDSAAQIKKLTEAYKKGQPVEPVMETRDAQNNIIDVDGRGRALAAHRAGVERIPIIVRRLETAAAPTP